MGFRFKKEYEEYMWQKRSQGTCKPQKITPHPTDTSEITRPLDLVAQDPLHPRDAMRLRMQTERDGFMLLASEAQREEDRAEYLEYAEHIEAVMRHVDHWKAWHKANDNG